MGTLIKSSILLMALSAGSMAVAQNPQSADQSEGHRPHRQFQGHQPSPQMEVKMLTKRLNLTPDQAAQIEPILADLQARMQALTPAEGPQGDPKTSRQQRKAILDDTKARLDAILTPEQQQELTKMLEHRHGRGPRGGQGGSWKPEGATTPSA